MKQDGRKNNGGKRINAGRKKKFDFGIEPLCYAGYRVPKSLKKIIDAKINRILLEHSKKISN